MTNRLPVHVRWMIRRDLATVWDIERASFEAPWTPDEFIRVLRNRKAIGMVAEHGSRIVGYMVYEVNKKNYNLLNFAVAADVRRRRVGEQMIMKLANRLQASRLGRHRIDLVISERNLAGQLFFKACGFRYERTCAGFYNVSDDDGYLFRWRALVSLGA